MASAVDICNLALSHLGDSATVASIEPPEGSAQAAHCARFYPIARDTVIEAHDWSFATKRVVLAQTGTPPASWKYSYAVPSDCVRAVSVLQPAATDDDTEDYIQEGGLIYTNTEGAILRYITEVADTTRYPQLVVNTISWLLASYLCGPITKGDKALKEWCTRNFGMWLATAKTADANAQHVVTEHKPDWIKNR